MDIDDPIQELLKNTGWSCEDLLEKLQKYKSQKDPVKTESTEITVETKEKGLQNSEEYVADSTLEINEKDVSKERSPDFPEESYSCVKEGVSILVDNDASRDFSDTDEEEVEVNFTNSNIINEIIDDISSSGNFDETSISNMDLDNQSKVDKNTDEATQITEVRVIKVNYDDEDEDDRFIEENSNNSTPEVVSNSRKLTYLETFSRKVSILDQNVTNESDVKDNDERKIYAETSDEENHEQRTVLGTSYLSDEDNNEPEVKKQESNPDNHEDRTLLGTSYLSDENDNESKVDDKKPSQNNHEQKIVLGTSYLSADNLMQSQSEDENLIDKTSIYRPCVENEKHITEENRDEDETEQDAALQNFEDIRNNLKLQLNSLRTRKKGHFLQGLRAKVAGEGEESNKKDDLKLDKKESTKEQDIVAHDTSESLKKNNDKEKTVTSDNKTNGNEPENLYTQTNEFGLVILNVQGGIELDDDRFCKRNELEDSLNATHNSLLENSTGFNDSNSEISQNNVEDNEKENDENEVFDAIRKIIRKQKFTTKKYNHSDFDSNNKIPEPESNVGNFEFFSCSLTPDLINENASDEKVENNNVSAENSLSSITTEDMSHKNSPFVSNTLDEFLGNAKLNISYNVPKSSAEDGITDSYPEDSPLILKKIMKVDKMDVPRPKKVQIIKAKTVAQRRKILERQRKKELKKLGLSRENVDNQPVKDDRVSPIKASDELYQKSIDLDNVDVDRKKDSYVIIDGKKIWVKSKVPDTCIAKINLFKQVRTMTQTNQRQRKLSLLTDLEKKYKEQIRYRPGPMSKKPDLQISGLDNWETEMKTLPKIFLDITPTIGQPISSDILHRLPKTAGKITNSQIEFALTMLKTKEELESKQQIFRFPVRYHNKQEKIVVRKKRTSPIECTTATSDEQSNTENVVASVIEGLIKYVEIKEIAPFLIKEEDELENRGADEKFAKMPAISENVSSIFKKPSKRRSKVDLELSRLSCKVVNVEVEEQATSEICSKPYCQLGCVCKSLKCDKIRNYHCQKLQCMLECTCPKEKSIIYDKLTLPAGTDILSSDTVNRIEDEAKKDLAKVEREFTQTVIHTSDKTIVVGLGGRNKTRRTTKTPRKYSDYVDSFENFKEEVKRVEIEKKEDLTCTVSLERLNLSEIIPYCLFHNVYNCKCDGTSAEISNILQSPKNKHIASQFLKEDKIEKSVDKKQSFMNRNIREHKISPRRYSEGFEKSHSSEQLQKLDSLSSKRPVRNAKKYKFRDDFSYPDEVYIHASDCARVRGFCVNTTRYRVRIKNRNPFYKADFINNISEEDLEKARAYEKSDCAKMLEVDILKQQLIAQSNRQKLAMSLLVESTYSDKNKHKRKQILEVRNDDINPKTFNQNLAIQRRQKRVAVPRKTSIIEPVFDGEIIIDDRNMELLQKMGPRTVSDGYARLLPWKALIESFNDESIKIWSMIDQPSRLLINRSDKFPPKNYIDITKSTRPSDVTLWILQNKLPTSYHEDNVSFILKQTKDNYEICGLCTKNLTEDVNENSTQPGTDVTELRNKSLALFKHKDLNGITQILHIKKEKYKLQELVEENLAEVGEASVDKNKLYMWAALPEIRQVCKWRMIFLNSDFTYLYFTKLKYSIKYTDLLNAGYIAKAKSCTVMLRNALIETVYKHGSFGIYFDSHYQDRLFIGPYFKQFNQNDIETLRYINKSLVCTESFNKMQGKVNYKCGHWLIERPYGGTRKCMELIDLTNDDNMTSSSSKRKDTSEANQTAKKPKILQKDQEKECSVITYNNNLIKVVDSSPRKPEDFNRYIITNIPHFGYLGAHQNDNSNEIDVSWPFESKLLRFPSTNSAIDFLQVRLSALLQPIPETFKIKIIIMTRIDLDNSHPINASIMTGHYICGDFGCYNAKTVTQEFCIDKLGMSKEALLRIFAQRAQKFMKSRINELADLVNIDKSDEGRFDIINILEMAQREIEFQKELEQETVVKKQNLLFEKRDLALKAYCMISNLPEQERRVENLNLRKILTQQPLAQSTSNTETIEIPDSDEEEQRPNNDSEDPLESNEAAESVDAPEVINLVSNQSGSEMKTPDSVTKNILPIIPSKVTKTATATFQPLRQLKLKSVLKSNSNNSLSPRIELPNSLLSKEPPFTLTKSDSDQRLTKNQTPQYLTGVKLVKTHSGKLMLVSDTNESSNTFNSLPSSTTKVVIKNSKILSVKLAESNKKEALVNYFVSDKSGASVSSSPIINKNNVNNNSVALTNVTSDIIGNCSGKIFSSGTSVLKKISLKSDDLLKES